jgi:hypothetical protein
MEASSRPVNVVYVLFAWGTGLYCLVLAAGFFFGRGSWLGFFFLVPAGFLLLTAARWTRIGLTTRTPLPPPVRKDPLPGGVELDAEILGRYEAGEVAGSDAAKRRQSLASFWGPLEAKLELELRYSFDGREIVSRCEVSIETFFHTRGMTALRIKVPPGRPERWVACLWS